MKVVGFFSTGCFRERERCSLFFQNCYKLFFLNAEFLTLSFRRLYAILEKRRAKNLVQKIWRWIEISLKFNIIGENMMDLPFISYILILPPFTLHRATHGSENKTSSLISQISETFLGRWKPNNLCTKIFPLPFFFIEIYPI